MRLIVIINQNAGNAPASSETLVDAIKDHGFIPVQIVTEGPEASRQSIETAANNIDAIIVAGGDGTMNALLPALLDRQLPVGIIPLGSANNFARSLNIPEGTFEALEAIKKSRLKRVDVARANQQPFLNIMNIGLSETITKYHDRHQKRTRGLLKYLLGCWHAWRNNVSFTSSIVVDGSSPLKFRAEQVSVANSSSFGRHFSIDPDTTAESGKLAVARLNPRNLASWFSIVCRMIFGKLTSSRDAGVMPARNVIIAAKPVQTYSIDGEPSGKTPVEIEINPQALSIYSV